MRRHNKARADIYHTQCGYENNTDSVNNAIVRSLLALHCQGVGGDAKPFSFGTLCV